MWHIAYCVLRIAYCVLRIPYCVLHIPYGVWRIPYGVLRIAYCVLRIAYCVLYSWNLKQVKKWLSDKLWGSRGVSVAPGRFANRPYNSEKSRKS